jgi:hypothetical protein
MLMFPQLYYLFRDNRFQVMPLKTSKRHRINL